MGISDPAAAGTPDSACPACSCYSLDDGSCLGRLVLVGCMVQARVSVCSVVEHMHTDGRCECETSDSIGAGRLVRYGHDARCDPA
jgi:hypothetical protein